MRGRALKFLDCGRRPEGDLPGGAVQRLGASLGHDGAAGGAAHHRHAAWGEREAGQTNTAEVAGLVGVRYRRREGSVYISAEGSNASRGDTALKRAAHTPPRWSPIPCGGQGTQDQTTLNRCFTFFSFGSSVFPIGIRACFCFLFLFFFLPSTLFNFILALLSFFF